MRLVSSSQLPLSIHESLTSPGHGHSLGERRLLTFGFRNLQHHLQLFTSSEGVLSKPSVPVRQLDMNEVYMSKVKDDMSDESRREDLGKGVRGKYFERVSKGTNLPARKP